MPARRTTPDDVPRAEWWEVAGAWLHLWTPPRGAGVPPVPWRTVAVIAAGIVTVAVAVALTVAPAVDDAKRRAAEEEARRAAAARQAQAARLRREQRATVVRLGRGALAPQVAAAIADGARARVRSGELRPGRVRAVRCERPERFGGGRLGFACLAVRLLSRTDPPVTVGVPFVAVVSRDRRSLTWCKTNEVAGEGAALTQVRVPLPLPCRR